MLVNDRQYEIHCPICGAMLSKSREGTSSEVNCAKCKGLLDYSIESSRITVTVKKWSTKQRKSA